MIINIIVPLGFSKFLPNVIDNFTRQIYKDKKLIIVENHLGIGACKQYNFEPDVLLTSDAHVSHAKNEGINYLRKFGGYWTCFDSDDRYEKNYICELVNNINKATIVGKADIFTKTLDDKMRLMTGIAENEYTKFINGPTISARVEDTLDFDIISPWGEDVDWLRKMRVKGATTYATSKYNFCYMRHKSHNHTWQVSDYQLGQLFYYTAEDKGKILEWDKLDYDMINGGEIIGGNLVEKQEFKEEDNPLYGYALSKMKPREEWIAEVLRNYAK